MKRTFLGHVLGPALMPALFFAVALTPVQVLGCRNRGPLALSIAFTSGLLGVWSAVRVLRKQRRGGTIDFWPILRTMILTVPVVAFVIMA